MRITSAVALLSVFGTPARSAEPMPPSAKWTIDFGDAHCVAMRTYGPRDKPITLAFKPSPIGDVMQVSVVRAGFSHDVDQYDGTLTVDRAPPFAVSVLGAASPANKLRISTINLPLATFHPIRSATSLRLVASGEVNAAFALTKMESVSQLLDRCVTGLRKAWRIGEWESQIKQAALPTTPLPNLFRITDYPQAAMSKRSGGTVTLVLLIGEAGNVASCMVTGTSGYASLDAQSCAILTERAKFRPALGGDGKPVKSGITTRIKWMMPA